MPVAGWGLRVPRSHRDGADGTRGLVRVELAHAESSIAAAWRSFAGESRMCPGADEHLIRLSPLPGVLQNDTAPMVIDDPPFFDFLQGSKASKAGKVIVQAAIADARRLNGAVDVTH